MKAKVTLHIPVEVELDGPLADIPPAMLQEHVERRLHDWNDGRYMFAVEALERVVAEIVSNSATRAAETLGYNLVRKPNRVLRPQEWRKLERLQAKTKTSVRIRNYALTADVSGE